MTRDEIIERRRQWASFNAWEDSTVFPARGAAACVADVGTLYEWLSPETRRFDPDPQKLGIQQMRKALARLAPSR
jgi:hypothetical protein